jgi:hypothetical protein
LAKADQIHSDKEKKQEKRDPEAATIQEAKKKESHLGNLLVNLHLKAQEMILDD